MSFFIAGQIAVIVASTQAENVGKRVEVLGRLNPGEPQQHGSITFSTGNEGVYMVKSADGSSLLTHPGRREVQVRSMRGSNMEHAAVYDSRVAEEAEQAARYSERTRAFGSTSSGAAAADPDGEGESSYD